jgi:hypothetical protein
VKASTLFKYVVIVVKVDVLDEEVFDDDDNDLRYFNLLTLYISK